MNPESPWAVICPRHGKQFLTRQQYDHQMGAPDVRWLCPVCGAVSEWDDDNYEAHIEDL